MPRKIKAKMILITVHIPKQMFEELDELVKKGVFPSRSEAIRIAIRELIKKEKVKESEKIEEIIISGR